MTLEYKESNIHQVALKLIENFNTRTIAFHGPMGAGKTTLIKAIVKELGGNDDVSSPTFGLVNEYHYKDGKLLGYHFDFYRLNEESEALDMGIEDYFSTDAWIFMEWPEKIENLLPDDRTNLQIEILGPDKRSIKLL